MIRRRLHVLLVCVLLILGTTGCGSFIARRMVQAPNTYPTWFAPRAPVTLGFNAGFLTNFTREFVEVGPPTARLCYRVVEPADYHLKVSSTNWLDHDRRQFDFTFHADVLGQSNEWTASPRGTVVLLHGYALAQFSMAPWAIRLAGEGWRCVLVDLRGHGKSTGKRIYLGLQETHDLSQLLDELARDGRLKIPVAAMGESYGAALALRWKTVEPRVGPVVVIAPYGSLSNAVLNVGREYAGWIPSCLIRSGVKKLPHVLHVPAAELDTTTVLARHSVPALFITAGEDVIAPPAEVKQLQTLAAPGSELVNVPNATHEAVTYFFDDLVPPVLEYLKK